MILAGEIDRVSDSRLPCFIVDAVKNRPFSGNPIGVVLL